ncbi:MAG: hypothetical protein ACLU37_01515 [Collinsella sp.]
MSIPIATYRAPTRRHRPACRLPPRCVTSCALRTRCEYCDLSTLAALTRVSGTLSLPALGGIV